MERTGHSRALRRQLKQRREKKGWSQVRVGEEIGRLLGRKAYTGSAVYHWETFKAHPPVDVFAAWARVLDMRLVVDLDDAQGSAVPVMVPPDRVELVRTVAQLERGIPEVEKLVALLPRLDRRGWRMVAGYLDGLRDDLEIAEEEATETG